MIQLRRLKQAYLKKAVEQRATNGALLNASYNAIGEYMVVLQPLTDEVSASIYGANINQTYRLTTPRNELEKYLAKKNNASADNTSKYYIFIGDTKYKIVSVRDMWVDVAIV